MKPIRRIATYDSESRVIVRDWFPDGTSSLVADVQIDRRSMPSCEYLELPLPETQEQNGKI